MIKSRQYRQDVNRIAAQSSLPWETLRGSRLLLTGATGMIGSFLVDVLMERNRTYDNQIEVTAAVRDLKRAEERFKAYKENELSLLSWDVTTAFTGKEGYDYMVHGASNTHPLAYASDPVGTIQSNLIGLTGLLEHARRTGLRRLLLLSSVEIYGENRGELAAFSESDLGYIDCNTMRAGYPESKRLSESLCQAYKSQYGIDFVTARLSRVYGPTMKKDDSKALSQFIKNAVDGKNIVLKSEGRQYYSYSYVGDAVSALLFILMRGESGQAYNIADKRSDITLRDLAGKLASLAKTEVVFELPDDKERSGYSTATRAILNADKLRTLGWNALFSMEEGLEHTVSVLREERL